MAYSEQYIRLTGFDNTPLHSYPVAIFDNDGTLIGYADDAAEVVTLWNGSLVNQVLGSISETGDNFVFQFVSPKNLRIFKVIAATFEEVNSNITLIGTSYFSSYQQTSPVLYDKIKDYWFKVLTGYTTWPDNNGKVSHDRLKRVHQLISGINYGETLFFYWCINDLMYQTVSSDPSAYVKAQLKVPNSHYTALANCFSKSFNYFIDAVNKVNTTNFTDTGNAFASKCGFNSKDILVLPDDTAYVEFQSEGKTNIVYLVSDGISQTLGTFDVYVNGLLYKSIECNGKTVDLTGTNTTIVTEGDSYCSPNSIVLNLPNGPHLIRIENTSSDPVWLDYHSELETDIRKGAKPVYAGNVPPFVEGSFYGDYQLLNATMQECNTNLAAVYDFWRNELGAPVALADVNTGFDPVGGYTDNLHWSQAGSDHVLNAFDTAIKNLYGSKILV